MFGFLAAPQHFSGQAALVLVMREENVAANDRVFDALRALDQPRLIPWQVVAPFRRQRRDAVRVEHHQVRIHSRLKPALAAEVHEVRQFRREPPHSLFERQRMALADPFLQQVRRQTGIAMLRDVRASVRKPEQRVGEFQQLLDDLLVDVDHRERDAHIEVLVESEVEDRVRGILMHHPGDLFDTLIEVLFVLLFLDAHNVYAIPSIAEDRLDPVLEFFLEGAAEVRRTEQRRLLLGAAVEYPLPRIERRKNEGIPQSVVLLDRARRHLRINLEPAREQRLQPLDAVFMRLERSAGQVEQREKSNWPLTLLGEEGEQFEALLSGRAGGRAAARQNLDNALVEVAHHTA